MEKASASEIANRVIMLQALLRENGVDAAIIRQNADLFYFTLPYASKTVTENEGTFTGPISVVGNEKSYLWYREL